ncbi:AGE family epimerase/isomerase [Vallitalea pronyensis]|uniref:Cellobiose 2-epimerase n=1 Tax=Vallitalea pronyensis TaxID=1348613 RepID=A0A8J8MLW6_9FIRM|nr:AGE family epimerase/isomerase [Vallitalea pronyensis]QUI24257.1 AGE family epimerase/isomerase [Vallitalea pronyensis]
MNGIKKEIAMELKAHILPFWMGLKDDVHGGFYGAVDHELVVNQKADKGGIASARILWAYAAAYRVTGEQEYLDCADHAYAFLYDKVYDHEFQGIYWMLDYQGNPVDTRKHIYAQAFAVYALSEYYRATHHQEALDLAKTIYQVIENKGYDEEREAYLEEFNRYWLQKPNKMLSENGVIADITTNTHLHILEAYTNLYRVWKNASLEKRLIRLVHIFYDKIYNRDTKFLKVFFDKNWCEIVNLKSFGHDIEASWLLDDAIKVLNIQKPKYTEMVIDIAYNIGDYAIEKDGSLINEEHNDKKDTTRIWWGQAEAMVGFLNAYERTGDTYFLGLVKQLWQYTKDHMIDVRQGGEWHWSIDQHGQLSKKPLVEPWKTPYHNTRFCIELMERKWSHDT